MFGQVGVSRCRNDGHVLEVLCDIFLRRLWQQLKNRLSFCHDLGGTHIPSRELAHRPDRVKGSQEASRYPRTSRPEWLEKTIPNETTHQLLSVLFHDVAGGVGCKHTCEVKESDVRLARIARTITRVLFCQIDFLPICAFCLGLVFQPSPPPRAHQVGMIVVLKWFFLNKEKNLSICHELILVHHQAWY